MPPLMLFQVVGCSVVNLFDILAADADLLDTDLVVRDTTGEEIGSLWVSVHAIDVLHALNQILE